MTISFVCMCCLADAALGSDWPRFRGAEGSGITADEGVPTEWSSNENVKWSAPLPGPGSSSPIVVGDRVLVTCYAGYGDDIGGDDPRQLVRTLLCIQRETGDVMWERSIEAGDDAVDPYRGFITEHGYASQTPVSDGERVFAFFGKSGVHAFDMQGNLLWSVDVGQESSGRRWGSAASLLLFEDLLIVNASEESQSIRALDQATGEERWKAQARMLDLVYATPSLVRLGDGSAELVVPVSGEVWGLDARTGKLQWYCETELTGNMSPSAVVDGEIVYIFGGRGGGGLAIRAGGEGNVTETHKLWTASAGSYIATPVLYEGHLYWVDDRGIAHCLDAATGEEVTRQRIPAGSGGRPVYASPVVADGRLIVVSRRDGTYVFEASPELELLAHNTLDDEGDFNATPAISAGELFLRSNSRLYCISDN